MWYTIAITLLALWAAGLAGSYTTNWLIHILPVIALVLVSLRVIAGRLPVDHDYD